MNSDVCSNHPTRLHTKRGNMTPEFPERPWDNLLSMHSNVKQQSNILVFLSHGTNLVVCMVSVDPHTAQEDHPMPLEESSPLMLLFLVSLICIFHPTQSNSYSFVDMSQFATSGLEREFQKFVPPKVLTLPSQTIMPPNYPSPVFPLPRRPFSDNREKLAQYQGSQASHNATRRQSYPWPSLPFPELGNRIPTGRQLESMPHGSPQVGTDHFFGEENHGNDPSHPEDPFHPSDLNQVPAPLISWLLGASIFGLMGFSRKPC